MTSVSTDRRQGVNAGMALKVPVRVATTANLAALSGLLTIDGIVLVQDDRVLVKNQTAPTQNGIYIADSGVWTRSPDFDGPFDVTEGTIVYVNHGTTNAGTFYQVTTANPITIDTSNITFAQAVIINAATSLQIVDSVAALKALAAPTTSASCLVRGFAAAGDGFWGIYFWNAADVSVDNGGTIIQPNAGGNGRWNKL